MKGLFSILLKDKNNHYDTMIRNYITSMKYYNIRTFIEPKGIKIYCNDYRATQYLACKITDEDVVIHKRFPDLNSIFRQIKIEELNNG